MKNRLQSVEATMASLTLSRQPAVTTVASAVSPTRVAEDQMSTTETALEPESSPTSVVLHPLESSAVKKERPPMNKAKRHSDRRVVPRVVMGDEGAEITLDTLKQQRSPLTDKTNVAPPLVTPEMQGGRRLFSMNSLLDADSSPSPDTSPDSENKEQRRPSFGAQMLCGSGGSGCLSPDDEDDTGALVNAPQASVERTITLLLGDPAGLSGWCHAWQAWFFFGVEHGESHDGHAHETKEDMKRVLRNRAYDLNLKSRRIKTLKDDLNPFDVSPRQVGAPIPLTKTRSFSGYESFPLKTSSRRSSSELSTSVASLGSAVWDSIPGCGQTDSDSPAVVRSRDFRDDLCYDSDPEEITRRRPRHGAQEKRATFVAFSEMKRCLGGDNQKSDLVIPRRLESAFNDDKYAKDLVQEFMNEKFILVWHRSIKPDTLSTGTPQGMIAWIERGRQLNSGLIQPKLVWRPVKEHEGERLRLGLSTPCLESLELLDISRILEVNRINRKLYPFAKRKSCFLLETLDRKMLFEASSESERDHIVNGLKLMVARFASKVIVQDREVLDEFFTSFLSKVPGEAPRWTQESNTLSLL